MDPNALGYQPHLRNVAILYAEKKDLPISPRFSTLENIYRRASLALLQIVNRWLNLLTHVLTLSATEDGIKITRYALSRIEFMTSSLVSVQGYPLDHSGDEVHQGIHIIFVHRESPVGYIYEGRKEDVEEEGCDHPPLAKILLHNEPTTSDTFCITWVWEKRGARNVGPW